jgi:hypothetical protein
MSQAIVDPADLLQFAKELRQFNSELLKKLNGIKGKFHRLGDSWKDQERAKFAGEFENTIKVLAHFMNVVDNQVPFLMRKADSARKYLDQK